LLRLASEKIAQPVVFPNPSNGKLSIAIKATDDAKTDVTILDGFGRLLRQTQYQTHRGENLVALNYMENLPSDIYIIKVNTSQGESTHKVILKR